MSIAPGSRLGPYEIQSALGAGGMGEVYRARDSRLDRVVAVKVLPASLASDPQLRDRFEREARALAALGHPHICTLFDVGRHEGTDYLVMEHLDGETLDERLRRGALAVDQALQVGLQIADALTAAHRAGIVHRDLKPWNIMLVRGPGPPLAKLLDFGLAKAGVPTAAGAALSMLPTTPPNLTVEGAILGTFQYMAPEQLEGREADARSDIFAFGVVLYEMLTGRKAFEGRSQASLIAAILEREPPPPSAVQPSSPPALDWVVRGCLAKSPDERWQTARDMRRALQWIADGTRTVVAPSLRRTVGRRLKVLAAAAVLAIGIGGVLAGYAARRPSPVPLVLFTVDPPSGTVFEGGIAPRPSSNAGTISPDGRMLAFAAKDASGRVLLWVRRFDAAASMPLQGTDGATYPFWSPDSSTIGYFTSSKLQKIAVSGGAPQPVTDVVNGRGGTWNREGVILFAGNDNSGLWRVSADGGDVTPVLERAAGAPSFLPDDERFLFSAGGQVLVGSLQGGPPTSVLSANTRAVYVEPGYLIYNRARSLFAQPVDPGTLSLVGDSIRLADNVADETPIGGFSVSANGVLAYRTGTLGLDNLELAWVDERGAAVGAVPGTGPYRGMDLSPDGRYVTVHQHEGAGGDLWLVDVAQDRVSRLTFDASQDNSDPVWSPDGIRVAFASRRSGKWGLYLKRADGTGTEERLLEGDQLIHPLSWSPDRAHLVYAVLGGVGDGQGDLWVVTLADGKAAPLVQDRGTQLTAQISPDGRWIAYSSNESGRTEVYVRPFPALDGKWQVSTAGGAYPRWHAGSRQLFFLDSTNDGATLMAIDVGAARDVFQAGLPRQLFGSGAVIPRHADLGAAWDYPYAVAPDAKRFLVLRDPAGMSRTPITVVLNWPAPLNP